MREHEYTGVVFTEHVDLISCSVRVRRCCRELFRNTPLHHVSLREVEETYRSPTACALRERQLLIKLLNKQSSQVNQLMNQGTDQATGGRGLEAAKRALEEILSCSLSALRETQVT